MPIIEIHGKQVHIPEGSESAKNASHYLNENPDNAEDFFEEAYRDRGNGGNGVTHFTLPSLHQYRLGAHHMVLRYNSDGTYELRKKDKGILAS